MHSMPAKYGTDRELQIVRMYESGMTAAQIMAELGSAQATIYSVLKRNGIQRRPAHAVSSFQFNASYFSAIDTEPRAYWLGFLAADSTITEFEVRLQLSDADEMHVCALRDALESNHPVVIRPNNGYRAATLRISSKQMASDLARYGITSNKHELARWPDFLDAGIIRHYLRGYFDGNGSWHVGERNGKPKLTWTLSSNGYFLLGCQEYLIHAHGLSRTKLNQHHITKDSYMLRYGGADAVHRLYHLMYDAATIWLPRKRDSVSTLLEGVPS